MKEELKHNIEQKIKENVTVVVENKDVTKEEIKNAIEKMTKEEKRNDGLIKGCK